MDSYVLASGKPVLILDEGSEFKAVLQGAQRADIPLPGQLNQTLTEAYHDWDVPSYSGPWKGMMYDYFHRVFPRVYIEEPEQLDAVREACQEALSIDGIRGIVNRMRGIKRAAKNVLGLLSQIEEDSTS